MKKIFVGLLFLAFMAQAPLAMADTVSFTDTTKYWDGFANRTRGWNSQNGKDVIGTPNLTGGTFTIEGNALTAIALNYASTSRDVIPGDWFFDLNSDGEWDYVLHHTSTTTQQWNWWSWCCETTTTWGDYALYAVSLDYDDWGSYIKSFWPDGYEGRFDHPALANVEDGDLLEYADFSGWNYRWGDTAVWDGFSLDLSDYLGQEITYGFAMTCANDVLLGTFTVSTPEPGTLVLLGLGLMVLALLGRKRMLAR